MTSRNSCAVCGPGQVEGCWRCGSKLGHHHLAATFRDGTPSGQVAVCRAHSAAPVLTWAHHERPSSGDVVKHAPRPSRRVWLDRTYRRAVARLRRKYADEFAQILFEERSF